MTRINEDYHRKHPRLLESLSRFIIAFLLWEGISIYLLVEQSYFLIRSSLSKPDGVWSLSDFI